VDQREKTQREEGGKISKKKTPDARLNLKTPCKERSKKGKGTTNPFFANKPKEERKRKRERRARYRKGGDIRHREREPPGREKNQSTEPVQGGGKLGGGNRSLQLPTKIAPKTRNNWQETERNRVLQSKKGADILKNWQILQKKGRGGREPVVFPQ